ncbi:hypothetical protein AnaeK_2024 [Anaeromyxobacter sp. K]|uniref:hypothetical protein n=1 Tax=Anaeromyxobacter sp. (strain K) TaxID=447217 RepID=UPI00015F89BF|nr:hypothetical protein [Anaeromyxobacter sp. K]ACG73252.1 hypothetical protein AnaeK_2024 [Anaeromyxobacter sp. K]
MTRNTTAGLGSIADALGDFALRRWLERACVARWANDLQRASDAVAALGDELRRRARLGALVGLAGETLDARSIAEADGWVRRAMGEEGDSGAARRELLSAFPRRWRSLLSLAFAEGGTVGALTTDQLDEVAIRLAEVARFVPSAEQMMPSHVRAPGPGRPRDVAARSLNAVLGARGFPHKTAMQALHELGIERASVDDTGADPVKRIDDRMRRKK